MAIVILSASIAAMVLGCGLFNDGEESAEGEGAATVVLGTPPGMGVQVSYLGPTSLEERILDSPVIARVRLDSVSSTTESGPTYLGMKYSVLLEFSFSVLEYLKGAPPTGSGGSGSTDIVAVWAAAPFFDTRQEAEAALPAIAAARDARWDDHDAIVFLQQDSGGFIPSTQQADRYYLSWGGSWTIPDDGYSIASIHDKLWLPAEAAVGAPSQPGGDQQRFLMDVPPATGTAPTMTLGEIKTRVAAVAAKLDAGDGSEEYGECVRLAYQYERINHYQMATRGKGFYASTPDHELDSGLATSSVVYEDEGYGDLPDKKGRTWLNGGDADLFSVEFGDPVPWDSSRDGVNDSIYYARRVVASRPLPAGVYRFHFNNTFYYFVLCDGYPIRYEWTVTVTSPPACCMSSSSTLSRLAAP